MSVFERRAEPVAEVGVFGGSGFYSLLDDAEEIAVDTPYGAPSDRLMVGVLDGVRVAFLPRHGRDHRLPPHRIPYRANVWAMHALGVRRILGPCAAGSLSREAPPGSFVVCDQFVDRTSGRADTFYDGPVATHVSAADPYCRGLSDVVVRGARGLGLEVRDGGTMVVISGPRFSTRAESAWFASMGWHVVNMTGYPEAWLARELGLCYANISLITDYDVGAEDAVPVTASAVMEMFGRSNDRLRDLIAAVVSEAASLQVDACAMAVADGRMLG
jgi:5'-methylthioadenosine phosphorylase